MALIMCRVGIICLLLNLGASLPVDSSDLPGVSTVAEDEFGQFDAPSEAPGILLSNEVVEDSRDSQPKDPEIRPSGAAVDDSPELLDVHSSGTEGEPAAEETLDSLDAPSADLESGANDPAGTNLSDDVDAGSELQENLVTDMVNDVVHDMVDDVGSISFLAPEKGDAVPAWPITFPGCSCEWNEPGYSCMSDILAPDSMAGQPCCCCGLKCLKDHRCSNDECVMLGHDQQKEMEDEEKRIAELLNNSDVVLADNIPGFFVDLGKGQCTNKKIIEKCGELGLTPVCDHSSYAANAKVCWTNMQPYHWSQMVSRNRMKTNGFPIPEEFDQKSMGTCFMGNYPNPWALAPSQHSHVWTNGANGIIYPIKPGIGGTPYKGPTTPSKIVPVREMNDCSSELGCWRTLCVKKDPCSNCGSCGNPCGPCGKSNCASAESPCIDAKQMMKKHKAKWPHCTNIGCFSGRSFADTASACLKDPNCNGFSFTHSGGDAAPHAGNGCLKKNCEPERGGYGTGSHDYWAKGDCSGSGGGNAGGNAGLPQCASAPPSSTHLLVSGAWPCVKTGAPCRKVQLTASNGVTSRGGAGMEESRIGVTCCDANGKGSRPGCLRGVSFDQAVRHCKNQGLDLCTADQIKAGSGEATGCRFDHGLVWTCSTR